MTLTKEEVASVQDSWKIVKKIGLQEVGLSILYKLFTDQPHTKRLFYEIFDDDDITLTQETLRNNKKVTYHAERLAAALDKIVEFLENEVELKKTLNRLGKTHKFRKVEPKNFELLKPILLAVITSGLGSHVNDDAIAAWCNAYDIIRTGIINCM